MSGTCWIRNVLCMLQWMGVHDGGADPMAACAQDDGADPVAAHQWKSCEAHLKHMRVLEDAYSLLVRLERILIE